MDCPRCNLSLRKVSYGAMEVDICDSCWGFWLDSGELEEIVLHPTFALTDTERNAILDIRGASDPGPTQPALCPRCERVMLRIHYDSMIHLVVDRCLEHGTWLDTGEIKKVHALASRNAERFHAILLGKLGLSPQV